jgi:nicotinate phosphoribosyltransferase
MIQLFLALGMTEFDAFRTYSEIYPENCILLVDTINTLESGIPNAIKVFEQLRKKGYRPLGIRLDSGDLAHLSIQAAKMLDTAGFEDTMIVLSNELDELNIWQIITQIVEEGPQQGIDPERLIRRLAYGVGTRLITSAGHSALGGVYKLVAVYNEENWVPVIKVSENIEKTPNPGNKRVWRIYDQRNKANVDLLSLEDEDIKKMARINLRHANIASKHRMITQRSISEIEPLLVNILNGGKLRYDLPDIEHIRKVRENDIERLDSGVKRLLNPHISHVSITEKLWHLKQNLINSALQ